jgi:hypothetical protein
VAVPVRLPSATEKEAMSRKSCNPGVQTLVFPKTIFTKRQAEAWAKKHGFKVTFVDVKSGSYRIRQRNPQGFYRFASKRLPNGVVIVNGYCS